MLNLITPPAEEPLSLADAKLHLKVDSTDDDALISQMIVAARLACEHALGRALIEQTWERVLPAFPAAEILLGRPRVQQVVSVKYVDQNGVQQTLAPELYALDADSGPGWLFCAFGTQWPRTRSVPSAVRVRFTAGYGAEASSVPPNVVAWLKLQVGALYRNREAFAGSGVAIELPGRFTDALLDSERAYL